MVVVLSTFTYLPGRGKTVVRPRRLAGCSRKPFILLDPGVGGSATFLEEGLATWFQDEPKFHTEEVRAYIERSYAHQTLQGG